MRDVATRASGRLNWSTFGASPHGPAHCRAAPGCRHSPAIRRSSSKIVDAAVQWRERAIHIRFADGQLRVQDQPANVMRLRAPFRPPGRSRRTGVRRQRPSGQRTVTRPLRRTAAAWRPAQPAYCPTPSEPTSAERKPGRRLPSRRLGGPVRGPSAANKFLRVPVLWRGLRSG